MGRLVFGSLEAQEIAKKNRELEAVDRAAKLAGIEIPADITDAKKFFRAIDGYQAEVDEVERLRDELDWAESDLNQTERKFKAWKLDPVVLANWWQGIDLDTRQKLLMGKF